MSSDNGKTHRNTQVHREPKNTPKYVDGTDKRKGHWDTQMHRHSSFINLPLARKEMRVCYLHLRGWAGVCIGQICK